MVAGVNFQAKKGHKTPDAESSDNKDKDRTRIALGDLVKHPYCVLSARHSFFSVHSLNDEITDYSDCCIKIDFEFMLPYSEKMPSS